jgi:hypothetical protein
MVVTRANPVHDEPAEQERRNQDRGELEEGLITGRVHPKEG